MSRICPVCHIPLLQQAAHSQATLDVCPQCRGIWFDKGELQDAYAAGEFQNVFADTLAVNRVSRLCAHCHARLPLLGANCPSCGATALVDCPVCQQAMQQREIRNIVVDACETCQGVWLDGGELQALFDEYRQRQRERMSGGEVAAWAALDSLDWLFIAPDLAYHAGAALSHIPDAVGGVIDGVGHLPEFAGNVAESAGNLMEGAFRVVGDIPEIAGNVAESAGNLMEGAFHVVGDLPEIAGSVAEAGASFLETLFDLISSIFDQ